MHSLQGMLYGYALTLFILLRDLQVRAEISQSPCVTVLIETLVFPSINVANGKSVCDDAHWEEVLLLI